MNFWFYSTEFLDRISHTFQVGTEFPSILTIKANIKAPSNSKSHEITFKMAKKGKLGNSELYPFILDVNASHICSLKRCLKK